MKERDCVIAAIGKDSLHQNWIKGYKNFDLHLIIYDDSYDKYKNDTEYICSMKGYKLKLVYKYMNRHPEYLEKYEHFFIPDDDILMDSQNINNLFMLMRGYNLQIAQPGLSDSYYTYPHTLRNKLSVLHYTSFVEMMLPCFSKNALRKVLHTFNANESGWGTEWHWPILIDSNQKDMAVIDCLKAIHTRPVQSYRPQNVKEGNDYVKQHRLNTSISIYEYVPRSKQELKNNGYVITDLQTYHTYLKQLDKIAHYLITSLHQENNIPPKGMDGLEGVILFFINYARISEKRHYKDVALSLLKQVYHMDDKTSQPNLLAVFEQINIKKIPKLIFPSSETPSSPTSTISEYLYTGFTLLALLS